MVVKNPPTHARNTGDKDLWSERSPSKLTPVFLPDTPTEFGGLQSHGVSKSWT